MYFWTLQRRWFYFIKPLVQHAKFRLNECCTPERKMKRILCKSVLFDKTKCHCREKLSDLIVVAGLFVKDLFVLAQKVFF